MEDRVAEVLAQRASMENGVAAAIVLSVLAHASLSAIAVRAAWHHTAPQAPSLINIRFAPLPPVQAPPPAEVPAVTATTPPAEPQKPAEKPRPVVKPVAASPFGRSTKKPTEAPPAVQPAPVTTTQPEVVLEGGDFPYTIYIDRMKTLIGSRWLRPQAASGMTTIVYFAIDRDGTLRDARIEKPSENGTFDRAALRAVLESSPLPPLPFGYSGTYLGVHLTFR